jgi:tRNA-splicing ligase RtcB (3'-phosphate/5'-hydroxy nucleic acid ligase)
MEQLGKRLMNWASVLEDKTRGQAERTAQMPFIFPHVALMPDAHLGLGATVGSVIPTLRAIIPAAVGVDIGCFRGDTRVPLLNGTQKSLKDMAEAGGFWWVYSLDRSGQVVPGKAVALKTREDAELMRIVVSGGEEIICTPDHPFMLNDGTYREARDLRFNDSLMPLYRRWQTRDGYESVSTGKGGSRQTHVLVYEAVNGPVPDGHVVRHKNHVHLDNSPENLVALDARGRAFANASPEFQAQRLAGIRRGNDRPARQAQMAEVGTRNITACMSERQDHFREAVAGKPAALRSHKSREHGHNHKVISAEHITERADVYCLQVDDHHNFALAAGVFVHNCGMIAIRTQFTAAQVADSGPLAPLRLAIERAIPLSAGKYNRGLYDEGTKARVAELEALDGADSAEQIAGNWRLQLGSLGSGNHFVEICLDEDDLAWLFLHSGSRGVGNKLANKHIKIARALCEKWWIPLPDADLAYLPEQTAEFWAYIRDLRWAQHFALLNRTEMMARVVGCLEDWIGAPVEASETVNCHHNYTEQEEHFGQQVWLSRKGAIDASEGRPGLIPGSMGTRSYVVTGKGNRLALNSAPHGAGRAFSRSAARKTFSRPDLDAAMAGIEWRHTDAFLDEIPAAYKDVDQVMADAVDLVDVRHALRQIVNVKGD